MKSNGLFFALYMHSKRQVSINDSDEQVQKATSFLKLKARICQFHTKLL
jgi:hypothetical protein